MDNLHVQQIDEEILNGSRPCGDAALNERYQSYLLDFSLDNAVVLDSLPGYCITPLGYNQAVVYFPSDRPFVGSEPEVRYNKVPKCYGLMATRELEEIGVVRVQQFPQFAFRGQGTLIGIIDTGINLNNPLFLYENGTTKVVRLWDQTDQSGNKPEGFSYGSEWTGEELDEILTGRGQESRTLPGDEEGHGTFLAAIAAGREDESTGFSGVAPDSELVVVKLRQAKQYLRDFYSIEDGVWACQEDDVILAIRYILNQAALLIKPVSICLGIGTNMGGHSGTNSLARYISATSLLPGVSFHIAAGNEGISGHHYHGRIREGEEYETVDFNVAEGEKGFIMELWAKSPATFTVALLSPGGEYVERIQLKLNEFRSIRFFPEETVLEIRSFAGETISGDQVIRMNFRRPSPGAWRLFVYAAGPGSSSANVALSREFDIWMPISNFIKEDTFFLNADANDTITSPGDSFYSITYTPYDVSNDSLYIRASRGYTRDGRVKPDLTAPGVSVPLPAPGPGGRPVTRSGSSVAAAFGVGIGALMQEWAFVRGNDLSLNGQSMRFHLIQGASRTGPYEYPNREWGYGIVNIYDAFLSLRR